MTNNIRITSLVLRVRNIDKVSAFYEKVGLKLNKKYQNENGKLVYELGSKQVFNNVNKPPIVILRSDPNAKNAPPRFA